MIKVTIFYKIQSRAARDESPFYGVDFRKKEVTAEQKTEVVASGDSLRRAVRK